jgi:hypothetical protein
MTRRTRAQARLRLEIWDYARRYLNVKRLPPEVVRLLNEVYDRPELPLYVGQLRTLLDPYRKPWWGL